jgi:peptidoglycan/xylan/chitin deacetylase (PgdA/CDA1 family)
VAAPVNTDPTVVTQMDQRSQFPIFDTDEPPTAVPGTMHAVPILMYHYIRVVDQSRDPLGYQLSIPPETFARQLDWLALQGYTPIRMDMAVRCLNGAAGCPERPIALTFDDGYIDAYTDVLPMLQERDFVATFYIVGSFVGREGYMDWEHLSALRDAGMEIGAHSISHVDLTAVGQAQAYSEISDSRQMLMEELGITVTSFCYPAGRFNPVIRALVQRAGFTNALTTIEGWDYSDHYTLPRLRIDGRMTPADFSWQVQNYTP